MMKASPDQSAKPVVAHSVIDQVNAGREEEPRGALRPASIVVHGLVGRIGDGGQDLRRGSRAAPSAGPHLGEPFPLRFGRERAGTWGRLALGTVGGRDLAARRGGVGRRTLRRYPMHYARQDLWRRYPLRHARSLAARAASYPGVPGNPNARGVRLPNRVEETAIHRLDRNPTRARLTSKSQRSS